jgi:Domain of unknown function (DUF2341)/Concanavalin A-like lectin/glucanases superfamily
MKRVAALRTLIVLFVALAAQLRCERLPTIAGGGGTDVSNAKVSGIIVKADGTPADHAQVMIIAASYDPLSGAPIADSLTDTTDSSGVYTFTRVDSGTYNVQAMFAAEKTSALATGIHVAGDSIALPVATLQKPGSLTVMLPQNIDAINGYVYVPGTQIGARLNGLAGYVVLGFVPSGKIPPLYYCTVNGTSSRALTDTIQVPSAGMLTIAYSAFQHSSRMFLNTGYNGANINGNVYNFPVLIRLNTSTFNFAQAQANGNDVRFIKPDNTVLPYEIERWDAANGKAEIWVKVDTIYGNGMVNSFNMYWGNASAPSASSGATVFDTAAGFAAVLHLNTNCKDATINNNSGTNYGAMDTEGVIGNSKKFNGSDSIQIAGLLGSPANLSLSVWAQLDVRGLSGAEVISVGDAAVIRMDDSRPGFGTEGCYHLSTTLGDTIFSSVIYGKNLAKTGWHYITYSVDDVSRKQMLYIDGTLVNKITDTAAIDYLGVGINTLIGKHGNGKNNYNFAGKIDEVRINKNVLSGDWIKLCYMNQKPQDQLITFK